MVTCLGMVFGSRAPGQEAIMRAHRVRLGAVRFVPAHFIFGALALTPSSPSLSAATLPHAPALQADFKAIFAPLTLSVGIMTAQISGNVPIIGQHFPTEAVAATASKARPANTPKAAPDPVNDLQQKRKGGGKNVKSSVSIEYNPSDDARVDKAIREGKRKPDPLPTAASLKAAEEAATKANVGKAAETKPAKVESKAAKPAAPAKVESKAAKPAAPAKVESKAAKPAAPKTTSATKPAAKTAPVAPAAPAKTVTKKTTTAAARPKPKPAAKPKARAAAPRPKPKPAARKAAPKKPAARKATPKPRKAAPRPAARKAAPRPAARKAAPKPAARKAAPKPKPKPAQMSSAKKMTTAQQKQAAAKK